MGRFSHEAVAVDPRTGIVYETEDNGYLPGSGLYRFLPDQPGKLAAGGRLQMAVVRDTPRADLRGSAARIEVGSPFAIGRVDLDLVVRGDDGGETARRAALFLNGCGKGGAIFDRLEGCWFAHGSRSSRTRAAVRRAKAQCGSTPLLRPRGRAERTTAARCG